MASNIWLDKQLGTPDKLCWHEQTKKKAKILYPVRIPPVEETIGLSLGKWNEESQCVVQYVQYPHKAIKGNDVGRYGIASKKRLIPYYGDEDTKDKWCSKRLESYCKQLKRMHKGFEAVDAKVEGYYLDRVLKQSLLEEATLSNEEGAEIYDKANPEEVVIEKSVEEQQSDSGDDDDDNKGDAGRRKTEPLRVGDRIQFYKPHLKAGDPSALCDATILCINPKGDPILTIDQFFMHLPAGHQVKRIQRYNRGKLQDHSGSFRPINSYLLKKEGDKNAAKQTREKESARFNSIVEKNMANMTKKMEGEGISSELASDMLTFKSKSKQLYGNKKEEKPHHTIADM